MALSFFWNALLATPALSLTVPIPRVTPSNAVPVSQSLISFSLEQDRWLDWSGTTSRNEFFFNTLDNLRVLTGLPPRIRIGADSEDHTNYNKGIQGAQTTFPGSSSTTPYPEASKIVVGDAYYEAASFLPPGTIVTWGVNFGGNNITAAFLEAKAIVNAFASSDIKDSGITLDAIEIGNEADLYKNNGQRPSSYSISQYVPDWTNFATNVSTAVGISKSSATSFWGIAFAGSSHSTGGFSPQGAFAQGILNSAAGAAIKTISQHHYSGSFCSGSGGLLQDLMTKSTIRSNLTSYSPDVAAVKAKGLDYVLGETNSYACHGAPGVSNTAGAALWTLDYLLYANQIGISRVFFHEGVGYKYNLIQPVTLTRSPVDGTTLSTPLPPHVQPQYYGAVVAAEAIGTSGITRVTEISIGDSRIAGYAFFENGILVRAVFINSLAYFKGQTRSSTHLDLSFTGSGTGPTQMTIKRLAIGYADDTAGLTWAGQTYETDTGRPSGTLKTETANVSAGLDIAATEVVLVSFY